MTRNHVTKIGALMLAIAATFAFSIQIAAAKTKTKQQGLWIGGEKYFSEFQGKALKQSGANRANLAFGSNLYFAPDSIAFDTHENLWAVFQGINDNLPAPALEITRGELAALKAGNVVHPKVLISRQGNSSVPFVDPQSIGFDAAGDLWVVDGGQQIVELLASQIQKERRTDSEDYDHVVERESLQVTFRFVRQSVGGRVPTAVQPGQPDSTMEIRT